MMKTLETPRLKLRMLQETDIDDFFCIMSQPSALIGGWKPLTSRDEAINILREYVNGDKRWAIELNENKKVIGIIRLYPDPNHGTLCAKYINYILSEAYWGNGYMSEAVRRMIKYSFEELCVDLLTAFHYPDNKKSKRVLERCGFRYDITIEQGSQRFDGKTFDSVCYSLLKSDYCRNEL